MDTPEERIAGRLIRRHGLVPPVDIKTLAERYATVEMLDFPVDVDGVSLYLKSIERRPEILVNSNQPSNRRRFTIAHELGHVLIPWHVGSIVDDSDIVGSRAQSQYWEREGEANRFAAEVLMPMDWAKDFIGEPEDMADVTGRLASTAKVSIDAAVMRILRVGPEGYIVAKSGGGRVIWSGRTSNTRANRPQEGKKISSKMIEPADEYSLISCSTGVYHWWRVSQSEDIPDRPAQSGKEILKDILDEVDVENRAKALQSINGIIAVANGQLRHNRSREAIYAACLHNISNRSDSNRDIRVIMNHIRFKEFVIARSYEFNL